jgi:hypothetical protein
MPAFGGEAFKYKPSFRRLVSNSGVPLGDWKLVSHLPCISANFYFAIIRFAGSRYKPQ